MGSGHPPWWIYLLGPAFVCFLGFSIYVQFAGPEPVGWTLEPAQDSRSEICCRIASVAPESAAARAGLKAGDLLFHRDLRGLFFQEKAGREFRLEVERRGERNAITLALGRRAWRHRGGEDATRRIIAMANAALFLLVALAIVFARPYDETARWAALLLAGSSAWMTWYGNAKPDGIAAAVRDLPVAVGAFLLVAPTLASFLPPIFVTFFALFPRPVVQARWIWYLIWTPAVLGIGVAAYGVWAPVYRPDLVFERPLWVEPVAMVTATVYLAAAIFLLLWNYTRLEDPNERRRVRLVVLGFAMWTLAALDMFFTEVVLQGREFHPVYPIWRGVRWQLIPFVLAVPLTMAYAILRHRMFDIRIMIRQGLQYAAARGVLLSVVPLVAFLLVLDLLRHGDRPLVEILGQQGWLYLALGAGAFLLHTKQKTWLAALDRRFFRERYDAQRILSEVVEEVRSSRDFEKAARHAVTQIEATLHTETAAVLLRQPGEAAYRAVASTSGPVPAIPSDSKLMGLVRLLGKPLDISESGTGWATEQLPEEETDFLRRARLEWLFPVSLGADSAEAILALGPKRSEEPYSREDQDLVKAIAASLALLLERAPAPRTFPRLLSHRYRLERQLGSGGMATVYEALDTELERRVAVKLMRPELMASPEAVARFKREAKAAAGFSHPNVVTIYDFGVGEDQRAYLVMELLSGCTLRQELRERGRLAPARAVELVRGVCAAVAAAHERQLLHRDLKPENIFLVEAGETEVAKVLDFGVAKSIAANEETATVGDTRPGVLVGTVPYMSPEQFRGGAAAPSWDLWALAVMAYEMLAGAHPFAAPTPSDWPQVILSGRMIPLRARLPEVPESWEGFFRRALALDAGARPASAAQFAAEFQKIAFLVIPSVNEGPG